MNSIFLYTYVSVFVVSIVSLVGILTLSFRADRLQSILLYMVSFAAGGLFGDVFLHLLPEVVEEYGFSLGVSFSILGGVVIMFFVEKIVQWRHCHHADDSHVSSMAVMNLIGDGVHNLIDGLIIGVSYAVSIPVGVATTIAVIFHEIPQEIGDFGVLIHGGFSKKRALFINFLSALFAVIGATIALLLTAQATSVIAVLVPLAAGSFVYIAGADLIPELHKHTSTRTSSFQFLAFLSGIGVMYLLLGLG
jgi:zinc and cadmium transporter